MNKQKITVGITGANGFVGSSLFKYLKENEYKVRGIVRHGSKINLLKDELNSIVRVNYLSQNELIKAFSGLDVIVHCAARSLDWGSKKVFYLANVKTVKNITEALKRSGIKRIIHISTANVEGYGNQTLDESIENVPYFRYSQSKLQGENNLKALCEMYEIDYIILRPSAIYGPGDFKWSYQMIDRIKNSWWPLINNGKAKFTPLFIENLLEGIELSLHTKNINKTYNLTDNAIISWKEFSDRIAEALNVVPHYKNYPFFIAISVSISSKFFHDTFLPYKEPFITPYRVIRASRDFLYSCKKAMNELNYKPKSNIHSNIVKTVKWYNYTEGKPKL